MAEEAQVETFTPVDAPAEAAPEVVAAAEPAVVAAEPVAKVAKAKPFRKPRAKAALKVVPSKVVPSKVAPSKAASSKSAAAPEPIRARRKAKAARTPVPAASPAPQAADAPTVARRVTRRKSIKIRVSPQIGQGKPKILSFKETFMATPFDLTQIQTAFADIQGKAKAALEKSTAALGEANDFAKGNVEAVVESGKTFSAGLQDLGATLVAETRAAFEGMTADAKELAAAKSPTEFFQLQSVIARKQFDGAVAQASKSTEAWLKLANAAFAPLSSRVTMAVEKVSKTA